LGDGDDKKKKSYAGIPEAAFVVSKMCLTWFITVQNYPQLCADYYAE
jgi:hypothetical protein